MASLFEIGKTGVQAYRQALSVTGQNIANINTDGYNKRRADVAEVAGVTGGPTNVSDQSGLGVRVTNVRRSFDAYLADKTRTSQSDYDLEVYSNGSDDKFVNKDIGTIEASDIPDHDLLCGGFPCQDYSVPRTSAKGLEGKMGVLWWEIFRILKQSDPE